MLPAILVLVSSPAYWRSIRQAASEGCRVSGRTFPVPDSTALQPGFSAQMSRTYPPLTPSCDPHHGITVRIVRELELIDIVSLHSYTSLIDRESERPPCRTPGELTISKYVVQSREGFTQCCTPYPASG